MLAALVWLTLAVVFGVVLWLSMRFGAAPNEPSTPHGQRAADESVARKYPS